jgi:hypothetical protein
MYTDGGDVGQPDGCACGGQSSHSEARSVMQVRLPAALLCSGEPHAVNALLIQEATDAIRTVAGSKATPKRTIHGCWAH